MGSNTITINGKSYDAKTGRLLETDRAANVAPVKSVTKKHNGPSLDGFSRRTTKPVVAAHAVHSKTEKSKTLMRGAVKKPVHHKVHAKTSIVSTTHKSESHSPLIPQNHERTARAATTAKSKLISRFGNPNIQPEVSKPSKVAHLPVVPAPIVSSHHSAPLSGARPKQANPFQSAVDNATSHQESSPRKISKRQRVANALRITPRTVSFGSLVLAGVLFGGFFVYQNIPNLAMRVAATRSGVKASLPGYKPAGFAMNGPIKYSTGKISIKYRSNSDDRAYQVTQSASEWNSETLLENFVAVDRRAFQTYQDKGKTIYIYDDNNATWIDGGVWYQVEGASALNSDQLLRIANSL